MTHVRTVNLFRNVCVFFFMRFPSHSCIVFFILPNKKPFFFSLQVTKRRRIVARVQCRNIKNECPKLDCDEPVQLPGKCCKVCPGKTNGKHSSLSLFCSITRMYTCRCVDVFLGLSSTKCI